ncbi:MAG: hypothetical protein K9G34_08555, partial [Melioribacteraceae bacterium]|nr:hypothetical protein [Melioribacteraceae bacterium]
MNRFLKNPLVVRSLVGSKYIENAVKSFHSLRLASKQPVKIIFHDDGSCTENDVERLLSQIPNSELLRRKQVNEEVEDYLKAYPACRKYRNDSVWGLKLL